MPANIDSMFYVRQTPWHGLGERGEHALSSEEALQAAELNWEVIRKSIQTEDYAEIPGYKANIRATDQGFLGVVSNRNKIVQNHEAFAFTDELLGERVHFETAGSLQNGRNITTHDKNMLIEALKVYSEIKIDFVDSLLFAY